LLVLALAVLPAAAAGGEFRFEDRSEELRRDLAGKVGDGEPGFAIEVLHGDEVLLAGSYGIAELGTGRSIRLDTPFYVASLGKTFTAAAALKLREEGRLRLETPVSEFFPALPAFLREVTVYHLLTHTSGLPDYHDAGGARPTSNREVLAFISRLGSLEFRPGVDYAYSNTGYVLLAEIVAKASGQTYTGYLQDRFLGPLDLSHTTVHDGSAPLRADRAVGYRPEESGFVEDDYHATITGPGGIYSTVGDLVRWYRALLGHEVLGERSTALLFHMPVTLSGKQSWIAMGWFDETFGPKTPDLQGIKAYGAIGVLDGFRAMLKFFPEHDLAFVILSNRSSFPLGGSEIARTYLLSRGS
jgi:CubicO group peptidase (beta-lactamase class C family)